MNKVILFIYLFYLQWRLHEYFVCLVWAVQWYVPVFQRLLCDLVPNFRVDPQGTGQGQAAVGTGDPAAQWATDRTKDSPHTGQFLQAHGAESVLAVEHPRDPVAAGVHIEAHHTLQFLHAARVKGKCDLAVKTPSSGDSDNLVLFNTSITPCVSAEEAS